MTTEAASALRCAVTCCPGETVPEVCSSRRSEAETVGGSRVTAAGEELCWEMLANFQEDDWSREGGLWQIMTRVL